MLTCSGCTNTWTGVSRAHCSACHTTFGGVASFDRHRYQETCREPSTLGLKLVSGVWVRPAPPMATISSTDTRNAA